MTEVMNKAADEPTVLIITGMHRSGTSLTASLLQSAGVHIGDRLMAEDTGNQRGHFEDLDFVELHQNILQSQGISIAGWTKETAISVQEQYLASARTLVAAREQHLVWGWKDPRTTLFLDFWAELIPSAKFIFIHRSPWEVVDSLFRRGDVIFKTNPNFAVHQWINYNRVILNFSDRHRERCLLFGIEDVIKNPQLIVNFINEKFALNLLAPQDLYEESLLKNNSSDSYRAAIIKQYFPQAFKLYLELQQKAQSKNSSSVALSDRSIDATCQAWILQDWLDLNWKTRELARTQQQLKASEAEVSQLRQQLKQNQQLLKLAEAESTRLQQQLEKPEESIPATSQFKKEFQILQKQKQQLQQLVIAMESSKFWQLRTWWFETKQKLKITGNDIVYQNYLNSLVDSPAISEELPVVNTNNILNNEKKYQKWFERYYPKSADLKRIAQKIAKLSYQPLISIIVPIYNPEANFLREAIESVLAQVYTNWELCLADDCSTQPYVRSILEEYVQKNERIKVVLREENGHISRTSNSALEIATGEYIALLDHDDLLAPHALAEVVSLLNQHPEADFIYSDEDKIDENNRHRDPFFKPDWCPDSFLSRMYTCHLGVYRRSLVGEIGGFRVGFEGSQDYDLVLRLSEKTNNIFHIPNILYHWRIHSRSAAADANVKPYASDAAQKALTEAIARRSEPGRIIAAANFPGVYIVRYKITQPKLVSIIIPTKDLAATLDVCLNSIFAKTTYPNYEVVVIDNGSIEPATEKCFAYWQQQEPERFKCYPYDIPFNYSQINNYGVEKARGDYLLFLNNDTEVVSDDWLEAMVEQAQRPSIGMVGALLLYPDKTIQHAGVVLGIGGVAGHSHKNLPYGHSGYISQAVSVNNYSAVTGACLMCRREVFTEVEGFETDLAVAFNDIDFCLKAIALGYRNIYLPHVVLYHYESKSRGYDNTREKQARAVKEVEYMKRKWQALFDRDPCYSPHLTKQTEDYSINI